MVGDLTNLVSRLWAVLPKRWFGENSPNLTTLLTGIATPWVGLYNLLTYVRQQTRLMTATDGWLDLISYDFFGLGLERKSGESDTSYRARIQAALLRESATRSAIMAGLKTLTGTQPVIFEPANCADTGSYGALVTDPEKSGTGMAYGQIGGWGSLLLPYQCFVTVRRAAPQGIAAVAGYGISSGGYGIGAMSYVDLSLLPGRVGDDDIQAALRDLLPVNAVAWLKIV